MAVVYVGTDNQLQRRVAIKVMDPRLSLTHGMAARFLQEARIAARLQHPNIIVVHDVRHSDEIIFFVMSLIDGVAVDDLCRHAQPIPIDQIRWILFQATRALAYAHSEDIVHRDIKPANILLNLKGEVILTDFGIAKALGETGLTQSGTQVGTPVYMSPEQFSGVPVGSSSDQYALGVTAYELLAGHPPFSGDLYQLISAHGNKAPVPVRDLRPDCPAFLANAVMRMLEKNPEDRWPSLEDLQDVFGANMAMDGGTARRKLAETVRALHPDGASAGTGTNDSGRTSAAKKERASESLVVTISPPGATIFVSGSLELRASVSLDTGQSQPGTNVQWTSSDSAVLTVQPNGTLAGITPGTAVVRASVNGGWSEATIRVEAAPIARLSLTSPSLTLRVGDVYRPEVMAVDVNGESCPGVAMAWISRAPAVADLDEPGVIRAISTGMAVIDVSIGNVRRSLDVAVLRRPIAKLQLGAPHRSLQLGDSTSLTIDAFDDLGEATDATPARWTSSAPSIVHVDSTGRAMAIAPGVARISASVDEAADSVEIESLEPAIGSIALTLADEIVELGDEVTWTLRVKDINGASRSSAGVRVWSSDPNILLVDSAGARARAVHMGEVFLYAGPEDAGAEVAPSATVRIQITDVVVVRLDVFPSTLDLEVGSVAAVNVQAVDRRDVPIVSANVSWTVDVPETAVVEGRGVVRALAPGACTLRVRLENSDGTVVEANVAVRVRRASIARLSIASERTMLEVGESIALNATTWDAMDLEVHDAVPTWRSTHPSVARVDPNGQLFALTAGRTTITAELDGKSGQISLLIAPSAVESLTFEQVPTEAVVGQTIPLTVVALDRNGQPTTATMRWSVEPTDAASLTSSGELTLRRPGALTVRVSLAAPTDATGILALKSTLNASADMQVRAPRITALQFESASVTLVAGRTSRLAVRISADADVVVPPSVLSWSSENSEIVQVDQSGELRAVALGDTRVIATADSQRAVISIQVTAAGAIRQKLIPAVLAASVVGIAAVAWAFWPNASPADVQIATNSADSVSVATPPIEPFGANTVASGIPSSTADSVTGFDNRDSTAVPPLVPPVGAAANATRPIPNQSSTTPTRDANAEARRTRDSLQRVAAQRAAAAAAARTATNSPPASAPPPVVTPPRTVADTVESRSNASSATPPPAAAVEIPTAADLRAMADRIVNDVRSGTLRSTPDLRQFFGGGAEHSVKLRTAPAATPAEGGRVRTRFEIDLSRYNAGGALERRMTVVQIEVVKRGGVASFATPPSFGPIIKP